ncbi:MAG: hypothetical protein Q4G23_04685 [Clostridia bacterium]|nr:hypothetical protein [Clostridia bacterium]
MKKIIKGSAYKEPQLSLQERYFFTVRRAAFSDGMLQLFIEVISDEDTKFPERAYILEEVPVDSQVFYRIIDFVYPTEREGVIEIEESDFIFFSGEGYILKRNSGIGIDWDTFETSEAAISNTGMFYHEYWDEG